MKKPNNEKCIGHRIASAQPHGTYRKRVAKLLRRRIERTIMDVFGVDHFGFEAEKELGAQMKNCVIASQTGRRPCRLDQINADSKQSWYRLARNQINQGIVHRSECSIMSRQREENNCVMEQELDKDAVYHRSYSTQTANTLPKRLLKVLDTSNQE